MARKLLKSGSIGLSPDLNKKSNPFVPDEGFYELDGFHLDETYALTKWKGFQKLNSVQLTETGPATFTGVFDFSRPGVASQRIATGLTGVYLYNTPFANTWNSLSLSGAGGARTGTTTDLYSAVIYNDTLYFGNGVDGNLKYDGTTVMNMGITAPVTTTTAAAGAAGSLTGTYSYKITFYNSALGHESNPSSASNNVTVTSKQISLTSIPVSSDPQVSKRKIYRTTAGGAMWLYVGEIADNTTTTHTDNLVDTSLGIECDNFGNGVPPTFKYIEVWGGYTFMVPANSSKVYFSKSGVPAAADPADYRELDGNDGSVITGMKRLADTLVVFKGTSIWNASGTDRDTFAFTRQVSGVGAVSNEGIVVVPGKSGLIFPSYDGFHVYDGSSEQLIGIGTQKDYKELNQSRLSQICGRAYKSLNVILWIVSNDVDTQNADMFWYNYNVDAWGRRSLPNTKANYIAIMQDDDLRERFYIGGYTGYVWKGDTGGSDDGSSIACEVIDRAHPKAKETAIEEQKCFQEIIVWFEPISSAEIAVSYALDTPDSAYTAVGTIDASKSSGQGILAFNATGRRIFLKFAETSLLEGLVIRGWLVYYKEIGRRSA